MEAISYAREYSVKWTLTLEFPGHRELEYWDNPYFPGLIEKVTEANPWEQPGRGGSNLLVISKPIFQSALHPDYGPEVKISFEHPTLRLSHKQLWAYETWTQRVAAAVRDKLTATLEAMGLTGEVFWDVHIQYATPLRNPSKDYRVASKPGDIVRMSCGTLAVVTDFGIIAGGHAKELTLQPACGILRHLKLLLSGKLRPAEDGIDRLTKVGEVSVS